MTLNGRAMRNRIAYTESSASTKLLKAVKMQQNLRIWTVFEIFYTWKWRLYFAFPSKKQV